MENLLKRLKNTDSNKGYEKDTIMELRNMINLKEREISQKNVDAAKLMQEIKGLKAEVQKEIDDKAGMNTKLDYYYKTNSNLMADFNK